MRSFTEQVQPGDECYELRPVYVIALVDYDLPGAGGRGGYEGYSHRFRLTSDAGELFSDVLQLFFLELNKLPMPTTTASPDAPALTALEQWSLALRNMTAMDRIPDWVTEEEIRGAFQRMDVANMSPEERENWQRALAHDRDLRGAVLQQYIYGMEQGIEQGIEQGDTRATRRMARTMDDEGFPREVISRVTKLSLDELDDLLGGAD